MSESRIEDIHCTSCGAPAEYDIRRGVYTCRYCGSKVSAGAAQEEKRGFRKLRQDELRMTAKNYALRRASCTGCGAEIVFEEDDALSNCAFCGRALVRGEYLHKKDLPEIVIPFRITEEEAAALLTQWCDSNSAKQEAKLLSERAGDLKGFYLPYEFLRGPVSCKAQRISGGSSHMCGGFIDEVFVNCSSQLDNLLLDGMEPFDLSALTEFDYAYVAGHRVKIDNITGKELEKRVSAEVSKSYAPAVRKVLETDAVQVDTDVSNLVRMPALLPVYYLTDGELMAAVNGQTGRVSVRAIKESHYYFIPWWLKSIIATVVITLICFAGLLLFGVGMADTLLLAAVLAFFTFIVTLAAYSDTDRTEFRIERGRKIFTSDNTAYVRQNGALTGVKLPERNITPPVFFKTLDGKREEVEIKFSSPIRFAGMILMAMGVLFLPVIIALFLNGFDFSRLELGGSAAWFCIFVPIIPIFLLKSGRIELYDRPWIYIISEDGKKKRYREKRTGGLSGKEIAQIVLSLLFKPPACLGVWFGIACFITMCYLTAFGF